MKKARAWALLLLSSNGKRWVLEDCGVDRKMLQSIATDWNQGRFGLPKQAKVVPITFDLPEVKK